jgi:hypothetical protein
MGPGAIVKTSPRMSEPAEGSPPVSRPVPPWVVGIVGFLIGAGIVLRFLIPAGMDPTIFLALGERSPQASYARQHLGPVATRSNFGHDGQFFFIQANDPWYLDPDTSAVLLDFPVYRAERMLFPLLAGGFGLFPPGVIVWAMLIINLVCLGLGAFLAARVAVIWGGTPWIGLSFPLNVGLVFELFIGGSGILAYLLCVGAVYALAVEREWAAAILLSGAALSRETMIGFAIGIVVLGWLETRRPPWILIAMPVGALTLWLAYLGSRFVGISGSGEAWPILAPPFVGMYQAFRSWIVDSSDLLLNVAIVVVVVAFLLRAVNSRSTIVWGALPFVALATVLGVSVWRQPLDISRALAPVFTAAPFLVFVHDRGWPSLKRIRR